MDFSKLAKKLLSIKAFKNTVNIIPQQQGRDSNGRVIWEDQSTLSGIPCAISTVKKQMNSNIVQWFTQVTVSYDDVKNADLDTKFIINMNNERKPAVFIDKVGIVNDKPSVVKFYVK